jgi:hypothetical protein
MTAVPAPVADFIDAINRQDTAAFLAFFPVDGIVNDWGSRYVGHEAIRRWSDREFIGAQALLAVIDVNHAGDEVNLMADVTSKGFNGPSRFVFVISGALVRELRITAH